MYVNCLLTCSQSTANTFVLNPKLVAYVCTTTSEQGVKINAAVAKNISMILASFEGYFTR